MKGVQATIGGGLAALVGLAQANSDIVSLYTTGSAYITEASATLVLPKIPSSVSGDVAIWSAIMMENQASFLQGVTSNSPSGYSTYNQPVLTSQYLSNTFLTDRTATTEAKTGAILLIHWLVSIGLDFVVKSLVSSVADKSINSGSNPTVGDPITASPGSKVKTTCTP
jgi:hypothetical protein